MKKSCVKLSCPLSSQSWDWFWCYTTHSLV